MESNSQWGFDGRGVATQVRVAVRGEVGGVWRVLLALIEGVSIALTRLTAPPPPMPEEMMAMEGGAPMGGVNGAPGVEVGNNPQQEESGGIWNNIFGGGRDEEKNDGAPAMPKFKEELE